jgi:hypothetical protein
LSRTVWKFAKTIKRFPAGARTLHHMGRMQMWNRVRGMGVPAA